MVYKDFKDGIKLSRLGMGNMRLPKKPGGGDGDIDYEKGQEIIDYAMAHGINYYDTAYVYHSGKSEEFVGAALRKYPRDSYYIATKYNINANPDYEDTFNTQLERLGVDRIDFYLLHAIGDNTADKYLTNGCIEFFMQKKAEGKIKYLGFSEHCSPATLEKVASHHKWDFAQMQLNYFDWNYSTSKQEYEILEKHGIPIVVMESVRGGRLSSLTPEAEALLKNAHPDWSISSWAFRWLKRLPQVQLCLSGMTTLDQMIDNVNTYSDDYALTDEEEKLLFKACDMFHEQVKVPCTACRYCTDGCPAKINIPEVLKVYNAYKLDGPWALMGMRNVDSEGKPTDCIQCGACTVECPQSISVPEIMQELAERMREMENRH